MSVVDGIKVPCPQCHKVTVIQSKGAVSPMGFEYTFKNAPAAVLLYVENDEITCSHCATVFRIELGYIPREAAFIIADEEDD